MTARTVVVRGGYGTIGASERLNLTREDILVVFEGQDRTFWHRGERHFQLLGVWPNAEQHGEVVEHLAAGGQVIVVLDAETAIIPILLEELSLPADRLPLRWLTSDYAEMTVRALDWLPTLARAQCLRLVADLREALGSERPSIFDAVRHVAVQSLATPRVKIVCLRSGCVLTDADILELVHHG